MRLSRTNWGQIEMTSEAPAVRRVPRGRERREQLVRVAEEVFLVHGFADSTMQTIASRAGASKETLYRHFASKEALFAEVVGRRAAQISGPESALSSKAPPRRVLFELGCGLLRLMTQGEVVPLLRLVIAESARTPELGAILYAKGPGATCDRLTDYLRAATARGELNCRRPERAAKLFLGAVITNYRVQALIDPPKTPVEETEIRDHARGAVAMFLAYYAQARVKIQHLTRATWTVASGRRWNAFDRGRRARGPLQARRMRAVDQGRQGRDRIDAAAARRSLSLSGARPIQVLARDLSPERRCWDRAHCPIPDCRGRWRL